MADLDTLMRQQLVDGLLGYLEVRQWASDKIRAVTPGTNLIDLRMHHYLYFSNLFGAIDLIRDHLKPKGREPAFVRHIQQGFKHPDDYWYVRELRNAIVHRGLDAAAMGAEREGRLVVMAPVVVHSLNGKESYQRIHISMIEVAEACDLASNAAMLAVLERDGLLDPTALAGDQTQVLEVLGAAPHVPEWVLPLAEAAFADFDFAAIAGMVAAQRVARLRVLLGGT